MPTSSERLRARAEVYGKICDFLADLVNTTDDAEIATEADWVAHRVYRDYDRLHQLAATRAKKEQSLEHRRKQG